MSIRWTSASSAALVALLACAAAADEKQAERLFLEGRALMKKERVAEACELFARSQALDPAYGTLLNLGECSAKLGRTATAWRAFRQAQDMAVRDGKPDRVTDAGDRALAVEPRLGRLRIEVRGDAPGVEVLVDGAAIEPAHAVPLDPGEHQVEARAPGFQPARATATVEPDGATRTLALGPLARAPDPFAPAPDAPAPPGRRKLIGGVIAGAGVTALGVGLFFGARAMSLWSDAEDECGPAGCTAHGVDLGRSADSAATAANVLIAGGAVAAAAGVIVWLTAPRPQDRAAWRLVPRAGGAAVEVRF